MTNRLWIGGGTNQASDPSNWSPSGTPQAGDTLAMIGNRFGTGDTMYVRGFDLAGDTVTFGTTPSLETFPLTVDLTNGLLNGSFETFAETKLTINAHGWLNGLKLMQPHPSSVDLTVNQSPRTWVYTDVSFDFGKVTFNGDTDSVLLNSSFSLDGTHATINEDVVGTGSFHANFAQHTSGFLEFGKSVSAGETVFARGNGYASARGEVQIDQPDSFHAKLDLGNYSIADLIGLGSKVDSYGINADLISFYQGNKVADTFRFANTADPVNGVRETQVTVADGNVYLSTAGIRPPGDALALHTS